MKIMVQEMAKASFLIFLAELGDKTQILAMAFALQFSIRQVLTGVSLGSLFNHGLAVVVGVYFAHLFPLKMIKLTSALLFLGFGLWSLYDDGEDDKQEQSSSGNPILVVALAFFLGELGDKTQLTAIALASASIYPWAILAGTVLGMVLTSLMGIIVGRKLGERIPEFTLKLISGSVFIGFGMVYLGQTVPPRFLTPLNIMIFVAALLAIIFILVIPPLQNYLRGDNKKGKLKRVAGTLYALEIALQGLCLNEQKCRGGQCPIGYCQNLIRAELAGETIKKTRRSSVVEPFLKRDQIFEPLKVQRILKLLDESELAPWTYRELKANLEKLLSPHQ